jgi:hypothetical protein
MKDTKPRGWTSEDARLDTSWIQRLSADEVGGFDAALAHAKAAGKPWLAMSAQDFPLTEAALGALRRAFATSQGRWGMCLLKGFPVDRWSEEDTKLAYWGMGLHVGVARTQNPASQYMNDVRDEGAAYKAANGRSRGYNTKAGLDFHMDSCDVVALLCRRTAKTGGESLVASTIAAAEELGRRRPDLLAVLQQPWYHHYQGSQDPAQPPYYACPIIGSDFDEPDRKRHLLRLWLAVPDSQPLPADWAEYFIDTRPGSVRGGLRGSQSTAEFAHYEQRQAAALGMACRPWAPVKRKQEVPGEAQAQAA